IDHRNVGGRKKENSWVFFSPSSRTNCLGKTNKANIILFLFVLNKIYNKVLIFHTHIDIFFCCTDYIDVLSEIEVIRAIITDEALIYVAGYVAYRIRSKYPMLGIPTREIPITDPIHWICHISRGSLIYPLDELLTSARILVKVFYCFHKEALSDTNLIIVKEANLVKRQINDRIQNFR
ncbi:hypothetical protein TSAR_016661, partial [Trichomalopsis sarcophagae]